MAAPRFIVVAAFVAVHACFSSSRERVAPRECTLDVSKDYRASSPLFLSKRTLDIVYPEGKSPKSLTFKLGEELVLHCFGGHLTRFNVSTSSPFETSRCLSNTTFSEPTGHVEYPFDQLGCSSAPQPVTREAGTCANGVLVNIGYQLTPATFKKTIDLCFVKQLYTTSWAHARIPRVIGGFRDRDAPTPAFSKGSYFGGVSMSQVYPKASQLQTFMTIFDNDKQLVERYLPQSGAKRNYLVKGHLVARADMFYYAEQFSTYSYVNVLPMWSSINNGNWKSVEATVRRTAYARRVELDVWTGGLGVLRLAGKQIYLGRRRGEPASLAVPVPRLLFKLVLDRASNEGLVFLTANDPYLEPGPAEYRLCDEHKPCADTFQHFAKRFEGYTYCCLVADFLRLGGLSDIRTAADFDNVSPLKLQ